MAGRPRQGRNISSVARTFWKWKILGEAMGLKGKHTLTVKETADVLDICLSNAYELIRQDIIPSIRFGRTIRIPTAKLMAMLGEEDWSHDYGQNAATETGQTEVCAEVQNLDPAEDDSI